MLEIVNEVIMKISSDTRSMLWRKKCAEVVLQEEKMVKGKELDMLEALGLTENEIYKLVGCEQGDEIDVKRVMGRVKEMMYIVVEKNEVMYIVDVACLRINKHSMDHPTFAK